MSFLSFLSFFSLLSFFSFLGFFRSPASSPPSRPRLPSSAFAAASSFFSSGGGSGEPSSASPRAAIAVLLLLLCFFPCACPMSVSCDVHFTPQHWQSHGGPLFRKRSPTTADAPEMGPPPPPVRARGGGRGHQVLLPRLGDGERVLFVFGHARGVRLHGPRVEHLQAVHAREPRRAAVPRVAFHLGLLQRVAAILALEPHHRERRRAAAALDATCWWITTRPDARAEHSSH